MKHFIPYLTAKSQTIWQAMKKWAEFTLLHVKSGVLLFHSSNWLFCILNTILGSFSSSVVEERKNILQDCDSKGITKHYLSNKSYSKNYVKKVLWFPQKILSVFNTDKKCHMSSKSAY